MQTQVAGVAFAQDQIARGRELPRRIAQIERHQPPFLVTDLQRFAKEARILGSLGHPAFVSVHHFAYTQGGLPYLVMERIFGLPLTEHARQYRLTLRERLAAGDFAGAKPIAHTVKGTAGNVGLTTVAAVAIELDEVLRGPDPNANRCSQLMDALDAALAEVAHALHD